jgi:hypothetical protein
LVYHSTLGPRVIKKKKKIGAAGYDYPTVWEEMKVLPPPHAISPTP